jgi:hypothetical protein
MKSGELADLYLMKRAIFIFMTLLMFSLVAELRLYKKWNQANDLETSQHQKLWALGQLNLVVERTFSLAAMTYLLGDQKSRSEAIDLIEKSAARIQSLKLLDFERTRDVVLGFSWLQAMITQSSAENSTFRLKAYRDLVVENQRKLAEYQEQTQSELKATVEEKKSAMDKMLLVLSFDFVAFVLFGAFVGLKQKPMVRKSDQILGVIKAAS